MGINDFQTKVLRSNPAHTRLVTCTSVPRCSRSSIVHRNGMFSTIFLDKFYPGQSCHSCWYSQSNDANPSVFWQVFFAIRWRWYVTWKKITKTKQQKQPSNQKKTTKKNMKTEQNARDSHLTSPKSWIWWKGGFQPDTTKPRVEAGFGFRTSTGSCLLGTAFTSESVKNLELQNWDSEWP